MKLRVVLSQLIKTVIVLGCLGAAWASAQPAAPAQVWRCGQLFTNQPQPGQACEPLSSSAPTVVEGTRVNAARATGAAPALRQPAWGGDTPATLATAAAAASPAQQQARQLLQAELREQEERWQQLQQQWNQGHPAATAQHPLGSPAYQERVSSLREQLQRTQADLAALRRELARLP